MSEKTKCTVYIDEAGDLGINRGTRWFVISAVIVDKTDERSIRDCIFKIRQRLNINEIHMRKVNDFYRRAFIVSELNTQPFTYANVIVDTDKITDLRSPLLVYNFACRLLIERVSWFLRDTNRIGDIVLSSRGTSRDGELIEYIDKLISFPNNEIAAVYNRITAKQAASWDLLQLADVCATTMFLTYEINNRWGFRTPCYSRALISHLYKYNGRLDLYGLKYFDSSMKPDNEYLSSHLVCTDKKRTPGTTTT